MSIYFPQVVTPTIPPQTTLDVTLTVQGDTPTGSLAYLRDASWHLQAVFTEVTRIQKFPINIMQGEYFLVGQKYTEPKAASARLVTLTGEDQSFYMDIDEGQRPQGGNGLLSGSFPLSMITQGGNLPSQADIRILYRPEQGAGGDGYVVATTTCNADGTWQVSGLDENLKFDIVARIPGYNDVIISDVQPTGAPLSAHFANLKEEYEYGEEVNIQVVALGGRPPYVYEAITLPDGLSLSPDGYITGTMLGVLELTFEVKIIDAGETVFNLAGNSYVAGDPHWDNVVSLLRFDGELRDEALMLWSQENIIYVPSKNGFGQAIDFSTSHSRLHTSVNDVAPWSIFTIECLVRPAQYPSGSISQHPFVAKWDYSSSNRLEFIFGVQSDGKVFFAANSWGESNVLLSPANTLVENVWSHVAVSYDGNTARLFVNGVGVGEQVMPTPVSRGRPIQIGYYRFTSSEDRWFAGSIDEVRLTRGISRYTENFTPPTAPFPNF